MNNENLEYGIKTLKNAWVWWKTRGEAKSVAKHDYTLTIAPQF